MSEQSFNAFIAAARAEGHPLPYAVRAAAEVARKNAAGWVETNVVLSAARPRPWYTRLFAA